MSESPTTFAGLPMRETRARLLFLLLTRFWIFLFLLGLILYFWITTPGHVFLNTSNLKNIALDTSEVILLAIGETFVIITAGIDLSVGGILVFAGVAGGTLMVKLSGTHAQTSNLGFPHDVRGMLVGALAMLAAGAAWGFANGLLITRLKMPPFIVTLGTLGMTFGAADLLTGGTNLSSVPTRFQDKFGNGTIAGIYIPVLLATRFGAYTKAIGSNEEGARRAGVNVDWHLIKVYTLTGFLCGGAALIDVARFGTENLSAHNTDNLNAIAAVVIGGTSLFGGIGTILGTVVGAFIPTVLQNGLIINGTDPFWQEVLVGATIIVAVYIDQVRRRRWSS